MREWGLGGASVHEPGTIGSIPLLRNKDCGVDRSRCPSMSPDNALVLIYFDGEMATEACPRAPAERRHDPERIEGALMALRVSVRVYLSIVERDRAYSGSPRRRKTKMAASGAWRDRQLGRTRLE